MGFGIESSMSIVGKSVVMCVGEGGVGETECVASVGSVWGVFVVCNWVIVVGGIGVVRSAIHIWTCWAAERPIEWNMWSSWSMSVAVMSSQR